MTLKPSTSLTESIRRHMQDVKEAHKELITLDVFGVEIETTKTVQKNWIEWMGKVKRHWSKVGMTGGEFTLLITPTSLGTIYKMTHVDDPEGFTLTDWRLYG